MDSVDALVTLDSLDSMDSMVVLVALDSMLALGTMLTLRAGIPLSATSCEEHNHCAGRLVMKSETGLHTLQ